MMSDVLSHATLPGIGVAFLVAVALGANGRSLPVLLTGADARRNRRRADGPLALARRPFA